MFGMFGRRPTADLKQVVNDLLKRVGNLEKQASMARQSIEDLESAVADIRADYTAKFDAITQSASDTQAKIDAAVTAAVQAKEAEDDQAFATATTELRGVMASHVATVAANAPVAADPAPADPAPQPVDPAPVATDPAATDAAPNAGTTAS